MMLKRLVFPKGLSGPVPTELLMIHLRRSCFFFCRSALVRRAAELSPLAGT